MFSKAYALENIYLIITSFYLIIFLIIYLIIILLKLGYMGALRPAYMGSIEVG